MADRILPHIVVPHQPRRTGFTARFPPVPQSTESRLASSEERLVHASRLKRQLADIAEQNDKGIRVEFESVPSLTLELRTMESRRRGNQPRLDSVREDQVGDHTVQTAVVFIPPGKVSHFSRQLDEYLDRVPNQRPDRDHIVENIQEIRRATLRSLWTDPIVLFPIGGGRHWWEVWVYHNRGETRKRLLEEQAEGRLRVSTQYLGFGRHAVTLVHATIDELSSAVRLLDQIAEIRSPHEASSAVLSLEPLDQQQLLKDLLARVVVSDTAVNTSICVLDERVNGNHALLEVALSKADIHVARPDLIDVDPGTHGTKMAGVALYGDLKHLIATNETVQLDHVLESVKVLWSPADTDKTLFASIVADATYRAEIQAPGRNRVFLSAVTANPSRKNSLGALPTSWSTAIDALAFGQSILATDEGLTYLNDTELPSPRLFVQSVGNLEPEDLRGTPYRQNLNDLELILDPAQAWNAISVGAFTEMDSVALAELGGESFEPLSGQGALSPSSRTSV